MWSTSMSVTSGVFFCGDQFELKLEEGLKPDSFANCPVSCSIISEQKT